MGFLHHIHTSTNSHNGRNHEQSYKPKQNSNISANSYLDFANRVGETETETETKTKNQNKTHSMNTNSGWRSSDDNYRGWMEVLI